MLYQFTTNSFIELITAFVAVFVIIILWKQRKSSEVKYLILLELMVAIWATTYAFEFATADLSKKILWSELSYFGIAFLPVFYFLFTTAFSRNNKLINKRNILLLFIIPFITLILALTNNLHHLIWTSVSLDTTHNMAHYHHGIWFWLFYGYAQLLIFTGLFNLVVSIFKFTSYYKSQIGTLLIGSIIPIAGNFLYISEFNPFPGFDWTPGSFLATGVIITFGIMHYRMFELIPFARKKLIDTMSDGVVVVNSEGIIEDCNPVINNLFGTNQKPILKKFAIDVFKDHIEIIEGINNNNEHSINLQLNIKGQKNYFQVKVTPIPYKNKITPGKLLIFNNITSLLETEIELKNSNNKLTSEIEKNEKLIEELNSFAHTVAHDLKNSLGAIYSSSEIIVESLEENKIDVAKEFSSRVKESSWKTIKITDELLKMATAGQQDVELTEFNMKEVFDHSAIQLRELIEKSGAEIKTPQKWLSAIGYAPWVEEVWVNFLSNAIKYGGTPPKIEIGNKKTDDNKIKYWVKDNGNGVPVKDHKKIFKKHTRLNPQKAIGYGLGLSIVKRIITRLNGTVGIESSGKQGEGALFYFILSGK